MFRSWRLGKLFAIPIYLNPTFLLVPLLVLWQNPGDLLTQLVLLALVLSVFGCVLLHELGHALVARGFGIGTTDITLYPIGGVARLTRMSDNPREELAIALAGPAVNVVIALLLTPLVLLLASPADLAAGSEPIQLGLASQFLLELWGSNLILALFNMIPAFPMDGGRVLRALLSLKLGQPRATEIAVRVGVVLAAGLALAGLRFNGMLVLVAGFVIFAGLQELFMVRRRALMSRPHPLERTPETILETEQAGSPPFEPASPEAEPGFSGFTWDHHYRVWVKWRNGRAVAAYWGQPP